MTTRALPEQGDAIQIGYPHGFAGPSSETAQFVSRSVAGIPRRSSPPRIADAQVHPHRPDEAPMASAYVRIDLDRRRSVIVRGTLRLRSWTRFVSTTTTAADIPPSSVSSWTGWSSPENGRVESGPNLSDSG